MRTHALGAIAAAPALTAGISAGASDAIPSPEEFFGFRPATYKLLFNALLLTPSEG